MSLADSNSLAATVHAVEDAHRSGAWPGAAEKAAAVCLIAGRQGLEGAYAATFAGLAGDADGIRAYTGEKIESASARHILGEECCRALRLLGGAEAMAAVAKAEVGLMACMSRAETDPRFLSPGWFCCGKCTVGMWRNVLAGGLDRHEERLAKGVRRLKTLRDGEGKWTRMPFWYTVLALADIDLAEARAELKYAGALIERTAAKSRARDEWEQRRVALARRAAGRIG